MRGKNILIISTDRDQSTNKVIKHLKEDTVFLRINDSSRLDVHFNTLSDLQILIDGTIKVDLTNIEMIWYRKGNFLKTVGDHFFWIDHVNKREAEYFRQYFMFYLENRFEMFGSISVDYTLNKLIVLAKAEALGLTTPMSCVTNREEVAIEKSNAFAKTIGDLVPFDFQGYRYGPVYSILNQTNYLSNSISFFQEYIEKEFEIRTFYMEGKFFSMAIFSQSNSDTRLDFRNYDNVKPNRNVPFKLPTEMEAKIHTLMQSLKLNTGSIDLIYSKTQGFVFLEVNPSGQFEWLSGNCNYHVEKEIAQYLYGEK